MAETNTTLETKPVTNVQEEVEKRAGATQLPTGTSC